jgi:hypothetical protein
MKQLLDSCMIKPFRQCRPEHDAGTHFPCQISLTPALFLSISLSPSLFLLESGENGIYTPGRWALGWLFSFFCARLYVSQQLVASLFAGDALVVLGWCWGQEGSGGCSCGWVVHGVETTSILNSELMKHGDWGNSTVQCSKLQY